MRRLAMSLASLVASAVLARSAMGGPAGVDAPVVVATSRAVRVVDARVDTEPGVFDHGVFRVRLEDATGGPLGEPPAVSSTTEGARLGSLVATSSPGFFVASADWRSGTEELVVVIGRGLDALTLPALSLPTPPLPRATRPPEPRVVVALGLGLSTYDRSWSSAGWRGTLSVVYAVPFGGGAAGLGIALSYERAASLWVTGILPRTRAVSDVSNLGVGVPLVWRAAQVGVVPYVALVPGFTFQNMRYVVIPDAIDKDAILFTLPVVFGGEVPAGPGGVFAELGYRASWAVTSGPSVSQRGIEAGAGYHLVF